MSWLPDLDKWADVIQNFLKPSERFVFVEFHPFVWMFDDDLEKIRYNYFNKKTLIEIEEESYADRSANLKN
tara:strand:+ start:800 stop:1012 length:213 start_codon:yes stop_codon:yes gene_type:complete